MRERRLELASLERDIRAGALEIPVLDRLRSVREEALGPLHPRVRRGRALELVVAGDPQRKAGSATRVARSDLPRVRTLAGVDREIHLAAPPGRVGEALEILGIERRRTVESGQELGRFL